MSYKIIMGEVVQLIHEEKLLACEKFGEKHNSYHEAYAVIREEFEEALDEVIKCENSIDKLWDATKKNKSDWSQRRASEEIYDSAVRLACESIQLAAMARKTMDGVVVEPGVKKNCRGESDE